MRVDTAETIRTMPGRRFAASKKALAGRGSHGFLGWSEGMIVFVQGTTARVARGRFGTTTCRTRSILGQKAIVLHSALGNFLGRIPTTASQRLLRILGRGASIVVSMIKDPRCHGIGKGPTVVATLATHDRSASIVIVMRGGRRWRGVVRDEIRLVLLFDVPRHGGRTRKGTLVVVIIVLLVLSRFASRTSLGLLGRRRGHGKHPAHHGKIVVVAVFFLLVVVVVAVFFLLVAIDKSINRCKGEAGRSASKAQGWLLLRVLESIRAENQCKAFVQHYNYVRIKSETRQLHTHTHTHN